MTDVQQQAYDNAKELAQQDKDLISGACLMGYSIQSSCGEVTLSDAKVEIDGQMVSNNHVKGSKLQWFPKKSLTITSKFTAKLSRSFNEVGVKFGDLTVVPKARVKELQAKLATIHQEWESDVKQLMDSYDAVIDDHCNNNPDIAVLIRKHALPKAQFESRFDMTYLKPLAIQPLFEEDKSALEQQVASNLWQEIAKDALNLYKSSWFSGSGSTKRPVDRVSQAVRHPLKRLSEKMLSLSFLDESVIEVSRTIQEVFNKLPASGYIEGHAFEQLTLWVHVLSDEEKLRLHATGSTQFEFQAPVPEVQSVVSPVESSLLTSSQDTLLPTESSVVKESVVKPVVAPSQLGFGVGW